MMRNTPRTRLAPKKPTIKILFYTDDPQIAPTDDFGQFFGLGSMIERLKSHTPTFADLEIKWFSRNSDAAHHADNKLDVILNNEVQETNEPFDEIWFFGLHQSNTNQFSLLARRGGPESELNANEVAALTEWMNVRDGKGGGGILMTGDHSNETPPNVVVTSHNGHCAEKTENEAFLGLGRALGRYVPRAGSLRKWEGAPTYHSENSFSTICDAGFQTDRVPQQLQLRTVNDDGDPDPNGRPHPLFFYKEGQFIEVFPDHAHEGAVIIPPEDDELDPREWPVTEDGIQPRPHVVAFGRDARKPDPLNIIATYNGDLCDVGRIVADSTWHHYMNLNLRGFPHPAPEGSASDQIGQFYANLAVWLAPKRKREEMARLMLWELARYTLLLEENQDAESTGATAQSVMTMVSSGCEMHELMQIYTPRDIAQYYAAPANEMQLPSKQLFIGSVLKSYHDAMVQAETSGVYAEAIEVDDIIKTGIDGAFEQHAYRLRNTLDTLSQRQVRGSGQVPQNGKTTMNGSTKMNGHAGQNGTTKPPDQNPRQRPTGRSGVTPIGGDGRPMACSEPRQEWTIDTVTDPRRDHPSERGVLVFCLSIDRGIISGEVADGISGDFLSEVTGSQQSLGTMGLDADASLITLNFSKGSAQVAMSGVIFQRNFRGRFTTFVGATELAATVPFSRMAFAVPQTPGDGDTGSASGTQT
jgi:hypothetical protein